jgi:hypothetical protein
VGCVGQIGDLLVLKQLLRGPGSHFQYTTCVCRRDGCVMPALRIIGKARIYPADGMAHWRVDSFAINWREIMSAVIGLHSNVVSV